jgi:hypothetical protein
MVIGLRCAARGDASARTRPFHHPQIPQILEDTGTKIRGPGRELNPGPPPNDISPKKESYY